MKLVLRRLGVVVCAVVAGVGFAIPASAHVTVQPGEAPRGGYAKLAFRMPNEREEATTQLEVVFDEGTPISTARVKPLLGWTAQVSYRKLAEPIEVHGEERTEAVEKVVWTAQPGSELQDGQFQEFEVSVGPLPDADKVVFKALQTYAGGEVVRWIDTNPEADHPAPVLMLTEAQADHHGAAAVRESSDADGGTDVVGVVGLAVGVVALGVAGFALLRTRRG